VPSVALSALQIAIPEVDELLTAQRPVPPLKRSAVGRVIRRAGTVALSSHYERYLYGLNEAAVDAVNVAGLTGERLPEALRLYHSKPAVERLADTAWEGSPRAQVLRSFVHDESWLWTAGLTGGLEHARLLEFMTAPKPDAVRRYFRYWGIPDIFSAITRKPHVRAELNVKLLELVDKRNGIAHGDASVAPTYQDVISYRRVVNLFCSRVDAAMARRLSELLGAERPW
jgi:hypothetical protein